MTDDHDRLWSLLPPFCFPTACVFHRWLSGDGPLFASWWPVRHIHFFDWKFITKKPSWPSTNVSLKWQRPTACFWSTGNSSVLSPLALCRCLLPLKLFWFRPPAHSQTCTAERLQRSPSAFKKWTHLVSSYQGYTGNVSWPYIIWLYLIFC